MISLNTDQDIKIAGNRPSEDVRRNNRLNEIESVEIPAETERAKRFGIMVADSFIRDANDAKSTDNNGNFEMMIQRRLLLSFTATVGFERYCRDETLGGIAQKSFLDHLKNTDPELYRTSSDTGAFSFYYLAFRRDEDLERRIGQTFAMLCSHDGDPIFQELGEALYCWFSSVVRRVAEELNLC